MATGYSRGGYGSGPYSLDSQAPAPRDWTPIPGTSPNTWTQIAGAPDAPVTFLAPIQVTIVEPS